MSDGDLVDELRRLVERLRNRNRADRNGRNRADRDGDPMRAAYLHGRAEGYADAGRKVEAVLRRAA